MKKYAIVLAVMTVSAGLACAQDTAAAPVKADAVKPAIQSTDAPKPAAPAANTPETASALKVEKIVVAAGVENKEPVGEAVEFSTATATVTCWTKVSGAKEGTVTHIWYLEGKKEVEVALAITADPMRTWSTKTMKPGSWKVEAVSTGAKIGEVSFVVK